jgi:hypothetical protein
MLTGGQGLGVDGFEIPGQAPSEIVDIVAGKAQILASLPGQLAVPKACLHQSRGVVLSQPEEQVA